MNTKIILAAALGAAIFTSCCGGTAEQKVMARYVPERYDDFVFENNLIAGRIYGEALESCGDGQITSPGVDIWVKTPGALVCDQRYKDDLAGIRTYHKDWGNGKDCYKVARSLGGGASAPIIDSLIQFPATNYRSWEIVEQGPEKVVFSVSYPEWEASGRRIALTKTFTVTPDTYFVKVEDVYTFTGEPLEVAAGVFRHPGQQTIVQERLAADSYYIWERASDQSVEPEEGMLGVAVYVPGASASCITPDGSHGLVSRIVESGETFTYWFGSCWSKADIKTAPDWFAQRP